MNPQSSIITNGGDVNIVSGSFTNTSQINTAFGAIITGNPNGNGGNINISAIGDAIAILQTAILQQVLNLVLMGISL